MRGGKRPGAGRKARPNYTHEIKGLSEQAAETLQQSVENLRKLANGETDLIIETWEPAGGIVRKVGDQLVKVHPDTPDDKLIMTKRKVIRQPPDRYANEYIVNRILGRPIVQIELDGRKPPEVEQPNYHVLNKQQRDILRSLNDLIYGKRPDDAKPEDGSEYSMRRWRKERYQMCKAFAPDTPFTLEEIEEWEQEEARMEEQYPHTKKQHLPPLLATNPVAADLQRAPSEEEARPPEPAEPVTRHPSLVTAESEDVSKTQDTEHKTLPETAGHPTPLDPSTQHTALSTSGMFNRRLLPASDAPPPNAPKEPRYTQIIKEPPRQHPSNGHVFDLRYPSSFNTDDEPTPEGDWDW